MKSALTNKSIHALLALIFFAGFASAQVAITILPANGDANIYPGEHKSFDLNVTNLGADISHTGVYVSSSGNISLLNGSERRQSRFFALDRFVFGESRIIPFEVYAAGLGDGKLFASFDYNSPQAASTLGVSVIDSQVSIKLGIAKLESGRTYLLPISVQNNSKNFIRNVSASVVPSSGISPLAAPLEAPVVDANSAISGSLAFETDSRAKPEPIVNVIFSDSRGNHLIETAAAYAAPKTNLAVPLLLSFGIIVLVVLHFSMRGKKKRVTKTEEVSHTVHEKKSGGHGH